MSIDVTYADEVEIRDHYQRMIDAWGDAAAYAECFTPDADYIIANGMIEHGWKEIVDGHEIIFNAWARDSRLVGVIESIRFITTDVALLIAHGHIEYLDHRSSDGNKRTVYSLVAHRTGGRWLFAAYQNTPLGGR
ncbi:SgcJ/EcaC family oxidoreductase [Demequina phytophila]|uniref:SgcJ/EcaC family oxidoreductase n=1 Tax=Demequina phytophila TaxID=1638981 RepID=UPI00078329EB|nr:SgcJ/EcaC family oxidoreductase [Demequina phytophila]